MAVPLLISLCVTVAAALAATGCARENVSSTPMVMQAEEKSLEGVSFAFRKIPAGTVETGAHKSLNPVRRFEVGEFWLATTPVTNADYERFDPSHKRAPFSSADDAPVTNVTWDDAARYCDWLSSTYGVSARLPTSTEWEHACLGGGPGPYPFGRTNRWWDQGARKYANFLSDHAVSPKQYAANGYGLYGMAGNVHEMCADAYVRSDAGVRRFPGDPDYETLAALPRSTLKVMKSCSAQRTTLAGCECSAIFVADPTQPNETIGFRVALSFGVRRP